MTARREVKLPGNTAEADLKAAWSELDASRLTEPEMVWLCKVLQESRGALDESGRQSMLDRLRVLRREWNRQVIEGAQMMLARATEAGATGDTVNARTAATPRAANEAGAAPDRSQTLERFGLGLPRRHLVVSEADAPPLPAEGWKPREHFPPPNTADPESFTIALENGQLLGILAEPHQVNELVSVLDGYLGLFEVQYEEDQRTLWVRYPHKMSDYPGNAEQPARTPGADAAPCVPAEEAMASREVKSMALSRLAAELSRAGVTVEFIDGLTEAVRGRMDGPVTAAA